MMITVAMQEKSEISRILNVEVPQDEVANAYAHVTAQFRQRAVLPGFRKGKVPIDLIAKNYAKEIREEVMDRLFSRSYQEALAQTQSVPIEPPKLENLELDPGKPLTYRVSVNVLPKVKLGNYKGMKLKKIKVVVTDEDIQHVLDNLRQQNAELHPVEGRPAMLGDVVTVDFIGTQNGQPVAGVKSDNFTIELGTGQTIEDFEKNIIGASRNETKTFAGTFPEDYHAKEIAGQTVDFSVTLKAIQQKKIAELNDAFAQSMGPFESLDALHQRIRKDLEQEKEQQNRTHLRDQIMKELGQSTQVTVPEVIVECSLDRLAKDFEKRLARQNQTWTEAKLTPEEFKKKNRDQVTVELKAQLGLREIARIENIQVTPQEVEAEAERLARMSRQSIATVREYLTKKNGWDDLADQLRDHKAVDWVIAAAKISET